MSQKRVGDSGALELLGDRMFLLVPVMRREKKNKGCRQLFLHIFRMFMPSCISILYFCILYFIFHIFHGDEECEGEQGL